ncbi:Uma2 family endonuclease [Falsiroseomonas sp. CW058]|uniref:Uma2 family endonuclease n=1 Tax=Falsiroseomonas sp. CW058 TaxID=3388664 RepID=UPI003D317B02
MAERIIFPTLPLTVVEFIPWAEAQPSGRFELLAGEVVAMAPERVQHLRAKGNAYTALRQAIRSAGLPCEALPDGAMVRVDDDTAYEPDVTVICGAPPAANEVVVSNPTILVEVTSPSNSRVDLTTKLADYFRIASVRHYLVVHLARRLVIHHRRDEDGAIATRMLPGGSLTLDPPGITVGVEDLFAA